MVVGAITINPLVPGAECQHRPFATTPRNIAASSSSDAIPGKVAFIKRIREGRRKTPATIDHIKLAPHGPAHLQSDSATLANQTPSAGPEKVASGATPTTPLPLSSAIITPGHRRSMVITTQYGRCIRIIIFSVIITAWYHNWLRGLHAHGQTHYQSLPDALPSPRYSSHTSSIFRSIPAMPPVCPVLFKCH